MAEPPFLVVERQRTRYRPVEERVRDFHDVTIPRSEDESRRQASRCLDCGTPFCHWACPLGNSVPLWNQYLAAGDWQRAYRMLAATNNLPEATARLCPAFCEAACVLNLGHEPVTNHEDELAVIEHAFAAGFVRPRPPAQRTGKRVAVVGSGPAGLACADQLNQAGHRVVVFERDARIGGLLRYGIPDFKFEKHLLDRRLAIWRAEGIEFVTGMSIGRDRPLAQLRREFDAVCLAAGCRTPRDLPVSGRELQGIHFAMPFLVSANRRVAGEQVAPEQVIDARGRRVVVIGGGDTGSDCIGTAHRQGAVHVTQLEVLSAPPPLGDRKDYWPSIPPVLRTSSSHEEGGMRKWGALTTAFRGVEGRVTGVVCARAVSSRDAGGRVSFRAEPGTAFTIEADLVLLAMGFVSAESDLLTSLGVRRDGKGNAGTDGQYQTSVPGVFAAGDVRRGQSLIVWALCEGRAAAHHIDTYLMGRSALPLP